MDYVFNGRIAGPIGNQHPTGAGAPHGVFPCAGEDRWISIAVLTDSEWHGLCAAMGNPQWATDPRLATMTGRISGLDYLHDRLSEWTEQFNDYKLAAELQQHGVAAAPVLNVADLFHDSHFRARNTFVVVQHPLGFSETIYGSYVKASRSVPIIKPGPVMGQDNERVLRGIVGLSGADYDALVAADVID
jgi:benzylsuccinate CoA-transferase BbsF subunit